MSLLTIALRIASTTSGAASAVRARRISLGKISSDVGPLAPEQPERDGDDDRGDHPYIERHAPRTALRLVLNMGRPEVSAAAVTISSVSLSGMLISILLNACSPRSSVTEPTIARRSLPGDSPRFARRFKREHLH